MQDPAEFKEKGPCARILGEVVGVVRVKVRPINVNGVGLSKSERELGAWVHGDLRVSEVREDAFGRVLLTARVMDLINTPETALLELHDVVLLSVRGKEMRMRGFEVKSRQQAQYAQAWDVEVE